MEINHLDQVRREKIPNSKMLQVDLVRTQEGFLDLQDSWKELVSQISDLPIFLTWEWVNNWWKYFGDGHSPWILTVRDPSDRLAGVAPWMLIHNRLVSLDLRRIAFLGSGITCSDHLDIIAERGAREVVSQAIVHYLEFLRDDWDVIDLNGLAEGSFLPSCLQEKGYLYREREIISCPHIHLPDSWDAYKDMVLSSDRRKNVRYYQRRLQRDYPSRVVFQKLNGAHEVSRAMDALIKMSCAGWREKGGKSSFEDQSFQDFHRAFALVAEEQGWLRLYKLKVDEEVAAMEYCFQYGSTFYHYQRSLNPAWNKYSLGQVFLAFLIQEAISEGASRFDTLRGNESYKSSWTNGKTLDSHVIASKTWQGDIWIAKTGLFDTAKTVGKKVLPSELQTRIGQLISPGL